jgi:hypothetical protein
MLRSAFGTAIIRFIATPARLASNGMMGIASLDPSCY